MTRATSHLAVHRRGLHVPVHAAHQGPIFLFEPPYFGLRISRSFVFTVGGFCHVTGDLLQDSSLPSTFKVPITAHEFIAKTDDWHRMLMHLQHHKFSTSVIASDLEKSRESKKETSRSVEVLLALHNKASSSSGYLRKKCYFLEIQGYLFNSLSHFSTLQNPRFL